MSAEPRTTGDWSLVARQQAAVADLGKLGLEATPLDRLLQEVARSVAQVLAVDSVVLLELMPSWRELRIRAAMLDLAPVGSQHLDGLMIPAGRGSQAGYTLMLGRPVVVTDLDTERRFTPTRLSGGIRVRSGLTAMIGWDDRPWGVVGAHSRHPRSYSDDDIHFLQSVANVVGLTIQRAEVEGELRERSARLDLSLAAGGLGSWQWEVAADRVTFSTSLQQLLGLAAGSFSGAPDDFLAMVHDDDRESVRTSLVASAAERRDNHLTYRVIRPDGEIRWFESRGRVVVDGDGRLMRMVGVAADITDRRLVEEIKASLLEREHQARLDAEQARERLSFLAGASQSLSSSLVPSVIYRRLADLVVPELCDICLVDTFGEEGLLVETAAAHVLPEQGYLVRQLRKRRRAAGGDGLWSVRRTVRRARSELVQDITDADLQQAASDGEHLAMLRAVSPGSAMVVPLMARGRVIGGLTLIATNDSRHFDEEDLTLAEDLAGRAAMAVDNARLFESRSLVARTLQTSLLPPALPILPGMTLAARYRVAEGDIDIGGDFYDVFEVDDGLWAAVIGDVCGRGPDAAALTGLVRHSVRAAAVRDDRPSHVLGQTNDAILDQIDDTRFCTAVFVRLVLPREPGQPAELTVCCGGHPRPMILRADGSVARIDAPGTLLGVLPSPPLADVAVKLEPGSSLVLYTDGITEARHEGEEFGEDGLMRQLVDMQHLDADALAAHIDRVVTEWKDGGNDDTAVMVLRVDPT